MRVNIPTSQQSDPRIHEASEILRACVHCGMCTATCPSYQILGDELDSPRGRIYLIKSMLEEGRDPDAEMVKHIDQCLSCLACTTTCPSGVDYMHLIDHTRILIEEKYKRPLADRLLRRSLAWTMPYPKRFRAAMTMARLARPFRILSWGSIRAMLEAAPTKLARTSHHQDVHPAIGARKGRVALLRGCVQPVLNTDIEDATIALLNRLGYDVVTPKSVECCGALTHHLGQEQAAKASAKNNINAWLALETEGKLDAIIMNASGCGTVVKDYGHMIKSEDAQRISDLTKDITEFLLEIYPECEPKAIRVAYHPACSLQHGQKVVDAPKTLLGRAGFDVRLPFESHLCCGSAGTYSLLQPQIARPLGERKAKHLSALEADAIATGNIGCMSQIGLYTDTPIVHTVELLNWAMGGDTPSMLSTISQKT